MHMVGELVGCDVAKTVGFDEGVGVGKNEGIDDFEGLDDGFNDEVVVGLGVWQWSLGFSGNSPSYAVS